MKSILLKSVFLMTIMAGILSGCVNSDEYDTPNLACVDPNLTATKTVQQIVALATSTPTLYTADDIIEAYVTTSDEKGNIYKSISFQTIPTDGSSPVGFSVPINVGATFGEGFIPGKKVFIKLNGLYTAIVYNSLQIGSLYQASPTATPIVGRISENEYKNFLFPSCDQVTEDSFVRTLTVAQAVNNANLNTLIELDNVQFNEGSLGRTYYDVDSGGGATSHTISATTGGTSLILRISSFAPFSGKRIPEGSGKIRGVLTKYANDFQFMIRYESDIKLTEPRVDANPPIVGNNIQFLPTFSENFESYAVTSSGTNFPKYINDAAIGARYWDVKTFSSNKYIQMTSFNSGGLNKTYLAMPVAFTAGNKFSFKSKDGFNNGAVLKVYYSTDYVAGGDISQATLVNITSSFAIASGTTSGYAANFLNSGDFTIPASLSGNGFFIFEYSGNGAGNVLTTTIQIDDIVVN